MNISEELITRLKLITSANISEDAFKKLLENTFSTLTANKEIHNINTLYNSKPDIVKAVYATLLTISAECGRNDFDKETIKTLLINKCNFNANRASLFADLYENNKQQLQIALGNIGSHLPHVTDVQWKIDYIIKSSNLDQADGPFFRVCLVADTYDHVNECKKTEHIKFSCNSQELQDLVYKLKDVVRHCHKLVADH